ncbi:MAG: DUF3386 domain-containing protein [Fischerella sp.]|nr:DUF3386 domain-containing protein [Fischerella sp.]
MKQPQKHLTWQFVLSIVLTVATLTQLAQAVMAQNQSSRSIILLTEKTGSPDTSAVSAREIFQAAYHNRYTWDEKFPGYTAEVKIKQGNQEYNGYIRVKPDLNVEVTGINSEDARQTVEGQLRMIIVHRRRVPFEVAHKNHTYELGATDNTGAVEIFEKGESTDARYRVSKNQITQVNRTLGKTSVTVNLLDSLVTPSGYLATRYRTIFRNPQTKEVLGEQEFSDTYNQIGNYYLLKNQTIRDFQKERLTTTFIDFHNIQLLSEPKR